MVLLPCFPAAGAFAAGSVLATSGDFGAAASMGVLLFFLILLITAAQFILAGRRLNSDL